MVWGVDDCLFAAAKLSEIQTGRDPAAPIRGRWLGKRMAFRFGLQFGRTREAAAHALAAKLGLSAINPIDSVPGDLGLIRESKNLVCCVCRVPEGWFARSQKGFMILPLSAASIAWRV